MLHDTVGRRAWTWQEGSLHREPQTNDQSHGGALGWQLAALRQCSLQVIQAVTGNGWGLLTGQAWIHFGGNIHQPWHVWGI